jgi:transposase
LIDTWKINIEVCALFTGINSKTITWYIKKNYEKEKLIWWIKIWEIIIPIEKISENGYFNPKKLWKRLNIDEKNIWNQVYTIYSNPDLWEKWLVWIFPWVKAQDIINFTNKFCKKKDKLVVKEISMDMANSMAKIIKMVFPAAVQIVDRFHVMKNVLEDMNALITKNKTEIKKIYLTEQEQAKIDRRPPKHQRYWNWETWKDIITKCRHQFVKRRENWNINQINRWESMELIPMFADIVAMYKKIEEIFNIYDFSTCKKTARKRFERWFSSLSNLDFITELQNTWRMIKYHFDRILNYFRTRLTNWYAEWLNSRIQRVISNSRWFKNSDYMIYRIIKIFW